MGIDENLWNNRFSFAGKKEDPGGGIDLQILPFKQAAEKLCRITGLSPQRSCRKITRADDSQSPAEAKLKPRFSLFGPLHL